jgi:hypothetical protein
MSSVSNFIGKTLGNITGPVTGAKQAGEAAERAAQTQAGMAQQGIDEQRRQFDQLVELLSPYREVGPQALAQQQSLLGLSGDQAQQEAIAQVANSPMMQALIEQKEKAILSNASATGGLRGGNTQAALAQYRPQLLATLLEDRYNKLGGLTTLGQQSAAGQASAGMQTGANVANLLGNQGAALAGGQMARGNVVRNTFGDAMQIAGVAMGAGAGGGMGGGLGSLFGGGATQMPSFGQTFNGFSNLGGGR